MSIVPAKLPSVPMAVSRPTLPPTALRDAVTKRIRKGPVIANRASGTKNSTIEARSVPTARLNSRHQKATGSTSLMLIPK